MLKKPLNHKMSVILIKGCFYSHIDLNPKFQAPVYKIKDFGGAFYWGGEIVIFD